MAKLGYRYIRSSASGRAGSQARREQRIPGDVIGFAPRHSTLPHLACEVGGRSKRVASALAELTEKPLPAGFIPIVARCVLRKWRWHVDTDSTFKTLSDALESVRDR